MDFAILDDRLGSFGPMPGRVSSSSRVAVLRSTGRKRIFSLLGANGSRVIPAFPSSSGETLRRQLFSIGFSRLSGGRESLALIPPAFSIKSNTVMPAGIE
jgi:hypothetical protein